MKSIKKRVGIVITSLMLLSGFSNLTVRAAESNAPIINEGTKITDLKVSEASDYIKDSSFPIHVMKMKIGDEYVKVNSDNSLITTSDKSKASIFEVYVYKYVGGEYRTLSNNDPLNANSDTYGDTRTNFVIKCRDNNKYLTIQNYDYQEKTSNDPYYNVLKNDDAGNIANYYTIHTFQIKASADVAAWNERFYIDSQNDGTFTISTHQKSLREPNHVQKKVAWWQDEDKGFYKTPITVEEGNVLGADIDNTLYEDFGFQHNKDGQTQVNQAKFEFEEVNDDALYINQSVNNNTATLTWNIIDGDSDVTHYTISKEHSPIAINGNRMSTTVSNIKANEVTAINITYNNGVKKLSSTKEIKVFNHPGLLMLEKDLEAMKKHVENKEEPWYSDYLLLQDDNMAVLETSAPAAVAGVGRGGPAGNGGIDKIETASNVANLAAMQWVITGDARYAQKAVNIINDWASNLKHIDGRDRILGASLNVYKFNQAVEILRYYNGGYSGFTAENFNTYRNFLTNVVYPVIQDLGTPMLANGSWDTIAGHILISTAVVLDDYDMFKRAVNFYKSPYMNGSIKNYISASGQAQELARDQGHLQLALAHMVDICEIAYNQGVDLYSLENNRLLSGLEKTAKHNLFETVDFELMDNIYLRNDPVNDPFAYWTKLDAVLITRGMFKTPYELALSHYREVGISAPWIEKVVEATQPQGDNYEENTYGTLTFYNGEVMKEAPTQYFKFRTGSSPYYQTGWDSAGSSETYNSYFNVMDDETIKIDAKYENAQYYELIRNEDNTYSIRNVKTNKYLSVTDEKTVNGNLVVKASAKEIGSSEKFTRTKSDEFKSLSNSELYLGLEKIDSSDKDPAKASLQLVLAKNGANSKSFILMYNIKDKAIKDIEGVYDLTELNNTIKTAESITNDTFTYTVESFESLVSILNNSKELINNLVSGDYTQEDIKNANNTLQESYKALENISDSREKLKKEIEDSGTILNEKDKYTEESFKSFKDSYDAANNVLLQALKGEANNTGITSSLDNLKKSKEGLVKIKPVEDGKDIDENVDENVDKGTDTDSDSSKERDKLVQTGSLIGLNSFMILGFASVAFGYMFMKKRQATKNN